jgi:FkbM family methyltransferase
MKKTKLLANMLTACKPFWIPMADRLHLLRRRARYNISYMGQQFRARAGVGDFAVLNEIFLHQSYADGISLLRQGAVVIDIGANIGAFSIAAAQAGAAAVHAFEPLPDNFELLRENIRLNGLGSIIYPVQLAVAAKSGPAVFHYNDNDAGGGTFFPSIHAAWRGGEKGTGVQQLSVECISLGEFFKQKQIVACDLLKLDCEGAEHDIISTLDGIAACISAVIFEYHSDGKLDATLALLHGHGFKNIKRAPYPYQVILATRA